MGEDFPSSLKIGMMFQEIQAFALAIDVALMSGDVRADTSMELAATGQETQFDVEMALRYEGVDKPVPRQGADVDSQAICELDPNESSGQTAMDLQVFLPPPACKQT